MTKTRE